MLQHLKLPIYTLSSVKWSYKEGKKNRKFPTFSSKSGRGHLHERCVYKSFQM